MRKKSWKSQRPNSLAEAMQLCVDFAAAHRRPLKSIADLMGVELKTLYRWLGDVSMPLNRIRQFEAFCGVAYVSEYLCTAHGDRVVVAIPAGKRSSVTDLAEVQGAFAEAMVWLTKFYQHNEGLDETVAALTASLTQIAFQRANVMKAAAPELALFEGSDQ